jgi:hypothetical protein
MTDELWTTIREDLHNLAAHFTSVLNTIRQAVHGSEAIVFHSPLSADIDQVVDDAKRTGVAVAGELHSGLTNATASVLASAANLAQHVTPSTPDVPATDTVTPPDVPATDTPIV